MTDRNPTLPAAARPAGPADRRAWVAAGLVTGLAVAVRLLRYRQSLWGDELDTLFNFVAVPWRGVVAAGAGQYSTNDHVLYSVLAKACLAVGAGGRVDRPDVVAALIRLPSLLAGSLLPVAVAWPLRRAAPALAVAVGVVAAVHPWLVALSDEARGYALMLLLGVLATHRLPDGRRRWPLGYGLLVAAMLYAVPVGGVLLIAHGAVVVVRRRAATGCWLRGAIVGGAVAAGLYLPLAAGVIYNYRHPPAGPTDYGDFVNQLFRFALAGQYLPADYDPAHHVPDPWVGVGYWCVPVGLLVVGTVAARRQPAIGGLLSVMATATAVSLAIPAVAPQAVQVRYAPWCGLWMSVALAAVVVELGRRFGRPLGWGAGVALVGWMVAVDGRMPPDQPVRDAIVLADRTAPPGADVVVAFLTAPDAARVYARLATAHPVRVALAPNDLPLAEARSLHATGRRPWLVISYEYLVHDLRPDAWQYLGTHYRPVERLPGRVTPVTVYAPR